jgi:hypothetical protein
VGRAFSPTIEHAASGKLLCPIHGIGLSRICAEKYVRAALKCESAGSLGGRLEEIELQCVGQNGARLSRKQKIPKAFHVMMMRMSTANLLLQE